MTVQRVFRLSALFAILLLHAASARGLTDEEIFREFRFNLINPGARSLAMGGAFISLADDATAAQANPAGLQFLGEPEYFLELRDTVNAPRSTSFSVHNDRQDLEEETGTDTEDVLSATFASAVFPLPLPSGQRLTVGLSRQQVLHSRSSTVEGFAFGAFAPGQGLQSANAFGSGALDVRQANYNVSAGFRIPGLEDRVAVGGSITFSTLRVRARVENTLSGDFFTDVPLETPTLERPTRINDSDHDLAFSVGTIVRLGSIQLGAVYRRAPKFSVDEIVENSGNDATGVREKLGGRFRNTFHVPDSYGAGISWQPSKGGSRGLFTLALDVERIEYSDLLDDFVSGPNILTDFDARFTVDDATELRLGAEQVLKLRPDASITLALRAGAFTQSDSAIRALSTGTDSIATKDLFPRRDREVHKTAGLGLKWGRFKVDVASDLGDSTDVFLVSLILAGRRGERGAP